MSLKENVYNGRSGRWQLNSATEDHLVILPKYKVFNISVNIATLIFNNPVLPLFDYPTFHIKNQQGQNALQRMNRWQMVFIWSKLWFFNQTRNNTLLIKRITVPYCTKSNLTRNTVHRRHYSVGFRVGYKKSLHKNARTRSDKIHFAGDLIRTMARHIIGPIKGWAVSTFETSSIYESIQLLGIIISFTSNGGISYTFTPSRWVFATKRKVWSFVHNRLLLDRGQTT